MMSDPPSPTVGIGEPVVVVGADEQSHVDVDVDRWSRLAAAVLRDARSRGELTLTFVDRDEIAALNEQHLGQSGPTDVLSFPLDAGDAAPNAGDADEIPKLLGDVVICPDVAQTQAATHAGTLDDELALLVVHGVLHVLGHDHATEEEALAMRAKELELLTTHHWGGPPPAQFCQGHLET
jgi:probable rRNA maturation factor